MTAFRLSALCFMAVVAAVAAQPVKFSRTNDQMSLAADPAATGGEAIAVRVTEANQGETNQWPLLPEPLPPGRYRGTLKLRLQLPKDFDAARLALNLHLRGGAADLASFDLNWNAFDGRPGQFTAFTREFTLLAPARPTLALDYHFTALEPNAKKRPVQPRARPTVNDETATPADEFTKTFVKSLEAETSRPVGALGDPVVLLDTVDIQRINDTVIIEKVWPEKIHVYPGGEANPVTVTVRNFQPQPATVTVRLTMRTGLAESSPAQDAQLTVPGAGTATAQFDWKSGTREYGHGACAELLVAGQVVDSATEYFSVSDPIWKTSLQGYGFLTWAGRENSFPAHVAATRANYMNVEEAFSWQPSSWTDLNPTGADWWTGQGNMHNSRRGLELWMGLSHSNGIKLITYSWCSASGPAGFEWARRHPELASHGAIGFGKDFDIEEFRLYNLTHSRPELKGLQMGNWHQIGVNLDSLHVIAQGADEIINSAKRFGWDGVRFDSPPLPWDDLDGATVQAEHAEFGITDLMRKLLPEYSGLTTGVWDRVAGGARNIRYLRHRFSTEISPHFAMSYNGGGGLSIGTNGQVLAWASPDQPKFLAIESQQGGQIMDEATGRHTGSWKWYREEIPPQVELTRRNGGYHEMYPAPSAFPAYQAIFTFAAGSHSYNWGAVNYLRFMTRYGEYCWDRDLEPITAEAAGLSVADQRPLLWQPYTKFRRLPNGATQTVLHLITPPTADEVAPKQAIPPAWTTDLTVHKRGTAIPTVWRLSAEPDLQCKKLEARRTGDGFTVTIPEHRLWTMLVWEEPTQ